MEIYILLESHSANVLSMDSIIFTRDPKVLNNEYLHKKCDQTLLKSTYRSRILECRILANNKHLELSEIGDCFLTKEWKTVEELCGKSVEDFQSKVPPTAFQIFCSIFKRQDYTNSYRRAETICRKGDALLLIGKCQFKLPDTKNSELSLLLNDIIVAKKSLLDYESQILSLINTNTLGDNKLYYVLNSSKLMKLIREMFGSLCLLPLFHFSLAFVFLNILKLHSLKSSCLVI